MRFAATSACEAVREAFAVLASPSAIPVQSVMLGGALGMDKEGRTGPAPLLQAPLPVGGGGAPTPEADLPRSGRM